MAHANDGRFVWHELLTTDPKAAVGFYTEVVGWKTQPWEGSDYVMWVAGQGPLGGVITLPEPAKKMNAPPHWMAHVRVSSVDKTVAEVRKLDGRVYVEPQDIPKIGRFAVVADPMGASLSVFTPEPPADPSKEMALHDTTKPGEFCWAELMTTDHEKAFSFYSALFGWQKISDFDMGPKGGTYRIYGLGGKQFGGMFTKSKEMAQMPNAFLHYIQVANLDGAVERAKAKGAKLMNGPMEVPGGARIAQLMDPQGAAFALHEEPKKAS
jgi:predicted enzyme related to lactoylglutathione lyase